MNTRSKSPVKEITFETLYRTHYNNILYYAIYKMENSKETAEDITGEAFTILYEIWDTFHPKTERPLLKWLRKTVRYKTYNYNRKAQKLPTIPIEQIQDMEDPLDIIENSVTYEEHIKRVRNQISERDYWLFEKILIENKDMEEIAQMLNVNIKTVRRRWNNVKKKIQEIH